MAIWDYAFHDLTTASKADLLRNGIYFCTIETQTVRGMAMLVSYLNLAETCVSNHSALRHALVQNDLDR